MQFFDGLLRKTKLRVAALLGLKRLFASTSYVLLRQLNADPPREGPEGTRRLEEAFLNLATKLQPSIFLDIGANDGSASLAVRDLLPNCEIHAFEANPQIYAKHKAHLESKGIRLWNYAVSNEAGPVVIYAPRTLTRAYVDGKVVAASITESEDTGKTSLLRRNEDATYAEFQVEATTIDAFAEMHLPDWRNRTAFLWIDVEGASDRVLAGAHRLLARTHAIFLEAEAFAFWRDQADPGSVVTRLIRAGFVPVARDRAYGDTQFNILFVHHDVLDTQVLPQLFESHSPLRRCSGTTTTEYTASGSRATRSATQPPPSVRRALQSEVPIFVPCFNAVTYARGMVDQLRDRGFRNIIVIDNGSKYPPMLHWLETLVDGVRVIRNTANEGPHNIYRDPGSFALLPPLFCITDPDLLFNPAMPDDFVAQLAALTEEHSIGKAGLALDISDPPAMRQESFEIQGKQWKIWEWEEQFWREPLTSLPTGEPVYKALIATTFAVYNKRFFDRANTHSAVRVAGRYTCRHLPWYRDSGLPPDEEAFYRQHSRDSYYLRDDPARKPRADE
ncbi:MAG TPA: FkbM family methyltransferase [Beijerinckiaceae bacterium]|jgi:FkbM family methyltransferase